MKKFIFFPLWKIENLEKYLETMEQNGYRLDKISHSYWFYFNESTPKEMHYFLSYKSFRGQSMGWCDYALEKNYNAHEIKSNMCFYTMYRTKEPKENLSLLYEGRLDYIKAKLLGKALTVLFLAILYSAVSVAAITFSTGKNIWLMGVFIGIFVCIAVYYFYGYFIQKNKCKNYEHNRNE